MSIFKRAYNRLSFDIRLQQAKQRVGRSRKFYHYHIRKTGGTSMNIAFLSGLQSEYSGFEMLEKLEQNHGHLLHVDGQTFSGWNERVIDSGAFNYAFSHYTMQELSVPEDTITFTCLRHPARRIISHYKMLRGYREKNIDDACRPIEDPWLGSSFQDFLTRIPKEHLLRQIYMFSSSFDINEAAQNIKQLDTIFTFATLPEQLIRFAKQHRIALTLRHTNKSISQFNFTAEDYEAACRATKPEFDLLKQLNLLDDV